YPCTFNVFLKNITDRSPVITITNEAGAASAIRSSEAYSNALTASVSKLKGRIISVIGSSFRTSIKTRRLPANMPGRIKGRSMLKSDLLLEATNYLEASSSVTEVYVIVLSILLYTTDINLTVYPKIKVSHVPVNIILDIPFVKTASLLSIQIKEIRSPTAIIAPG